MYSPKAKCEMMCWGCEQMVTSEFFFYCLQLEIWYIQIIVTVAAMEYKGQEVTGGWW